MALQNRKRDFTEETLNDIRANLQSPTDPYRDLSRWWQEYGEIFDNVDPSSEIAYLESHMSEFRELMGFIAVKALDTIVADVESVQTTFVTQSNGIKDLIVEYGNAVDILIETISDKNFATNFNKVEVMKSIIGVTPLSYAEKLAKDEYISDIINQYGFDRDTAELMWKVWQGVNDRYASQGDEYIAWMYNRILGGFYYDTQDPIQSWSFNSSAGWNVGTKSFLLGLGLTEEQYTILRNEIIIQHQMSGFPDDQIFDHLYDAEKGEYVDEYYQLKEMFQKRYPNEEITNERMKELYEKYNQAYLTKPDFAHHSISLAIYLNESLGNVGITADIKTGWNTSEMGSWLGDATLSSNTKNPVFGNDDYMADLDAENIFNYMKKYGLSFAEASRRYYQDLNKKDENGDIVGNRVDIFLENRTLAEVETMIIGEFSEMTGELYIYYYNNPFARNEFIENFIRHQSPHTYAFIMSMRKGDNTIGEYK